MLQHLACKQLGEWLFGYFVFCGDCVFFKQASCWVLGFQLACLFVLLGLLGKRVGEKEGLHHLNFKSH